MEPDIASTVTIERRFFETLVRRGQLQPSDVPVSRSLPNDALIVSRADHEALQRTARRYANLRQNLLRGGVGEDTINLLSQDDATNSIQDDAFTSPPQSNPQKEHRTLPAHYDNAPPHMPPRPRPTHAGRRPLVEVGDGHNKPHTGPAVHSTVGFEGSPDWADADGSQDGLSYSAETPDDADIHGQQLYPDHGEKAAYEKQCMRTIQLIGLPDATTHADITGVVRGGLLLDIFVRAHDRSATVSFLHSADARAFFDHCRRYDLYIRHKRIEVRWSDRQFTLSGHVASKIGNGATRNLVLRRYDSDTTEASIRDDLDHIHNLAVVKVTFIGGSCFISLNSVHNCIVAKTCMMSRLIEWDVDECAQPLDRVQPVNTRKDPPPAKRHVSAVANRFKLLSMDGEDEDQSEQNYAAAKGSIGVGA
ncbi:hypothetical protein MCOR25_002354 [Pyricularia grisea]|nr:hypothetical protein MCOR25_002354 [Pyricularia grisea]